MPCEFHSIRNEVIHVRILVLRILSHTKRRLSFIHQTPTHILKEPQRLGGRTIAPRTWLELFAMIFDFVRRLMTDVSMTRLDHLDGQLVQLIEIVA